ncbi:AAA family ATPase [Shimia sp. R9_2]|uniref:AAA family ATPase n=1 Tax=Shimia sp. R9_2 TaxID=2821112 RepID=UPI001ADAEFDF|nr:AAA family ATPase [Shimia sp. R9_2]MBO9398750.1 AAA family ATPase [Shimia sp. R9_2]
MSKDVMTWLQEVRKLDGDLLADMRVEARNHQHLGQVAAFPYRKEGEIYAAKFRTVDKKFLSTKDVKRGLYNADALSRDEELPIVITEGEIDCLTVIQSGFLRAVSLPDGWTEQGNKTEDLVAAEEHLRQSPYVIVAGDNDAAGESLPRTMANILAGHDVRYVEWPEGCKDANDVLITLGEGEVAARLNAAKRLDPPGGLISGFSDLPPLSNRRVLKLGRDPFDDLIALELGEISVWTGLPGCGKSTLVTWLAHEVAKKEGVRNGMIAFETHSHRFRDQLARIETHQSWEKLPTAMREQLTDKLDKIWRIVHVTDDDNNDTNLGWLESMIKTLALRDGCKVIIIDPWNELEHLPEPGESMTQYINFALRFIRRLAKRLEVHICVVAHPKKMSTEGTPRPPTGYDIADSAAFFNKPGLGITVHPGSEDFVVSLLNWKTRDVLLYGTRRCKRDVQFAEAWGGYNAISDPAEAAPMQMEAEF